MKLLRHMIVICLCLCLFIPGCGADFEDSVPSETETTSHTENPVTVQMSDYAGMEKVGSLETSLPRNDAQISVGAGNVILYQGNQITIYYGTNSWNFTRLARIEGATRDSLHELLGVGDVEVTFSVK
jgi:hypothetical protein